jgi:lysophospholipase L1-like esterase
LDLDGRQRAAIDLNRGDIANEAFTAVRTLLTANRGNSIRPKTRRRGECSIVRTIEAKGASGSAHRNIYVTETRIRKCRTAADAETGYLRFKNRLGISRIRGDSLHCLTGKPNPNNVMAGPILIKLIGSKASYRLRAAPNLRSQHKQAFARVMKRHLLLALALVVGTMAGHAQTKIMCLGDSITKGAVDPEPSESGYRAQLFDELNQARIKYQFIGCTVNNSNRLMISAGQAYHNGYGSYQIFQMFKNLDGIENVGNGDDNMGGYWLTGGHGTFREAANPDMVLILGGTNDLGAGAKEPEMESRMSDLLNWFKNNRSQAEIFVGTVPPRGLDKPGFETYNPAVLEFNSWLASSITRFGTKFRLVDIYSLFVGTDGKVKMSDSPDGIFLKDGIHPSHQGYVAMGDTWFNAIKKYLPPGQN